ncbi:unnamed protein product [Miscanthus lutarioriparius]|uniref:Uncharacterized protein n=1 Tax=Miscanthus lutarioriparius TaxID=422564 RepID=A0A811QSF1_9POAL|nr:unnamed protein product [Miscanthus lutarioriparius]
MKRISTAKYSTTKEKIMGMPIFPLLPLADSTMMVMAVLPSGGAATCEPAILAGTPCPVVNTPFVAPSRTAPLSTRHSGSRRLQCRHRPTGHAHRAENVVGSDERDGDVLGNWHTIKYCRACVAVRNAAESTSNLPGRIRSSRHRVSVI